MKKWIVFISLSAFAFLSFAGCTNPTQPSTTGSTVNANCVITSESTGLVGNEKTWKYEYDSQGMPLKVTTTGSAGNVENVADIFYNGVVSTIPGPSVGSTIPNASTLKFDADLFSKKLPSIVQISFTLDGVTQYNYKQFFFFYDNKDRLIKVGEQTTAPGDLEWDLNIFYNDQNNVTALQYVYTTGPRADMTTITVNAYDDKPTPYAAIPFWKFLMINFSWDNYDPEPILTALSQNNPLDYTYGPLKRTMSYKYNDSGFPIERTNTNVSSTSNPPGASYTFTQGFSYQCN